MRRNLIHYILKEQKFSSEKTHLEEEKIMKIRKIRIINYRSIQDSGDIYLEDRITILAGKNESGKTAILQALSDFDKQKSIRSEAIPVESPDHLPQVSVSFDVLPELMNSILEPIGLDCHLSSGVNIEISKTYPNKYSFSQETAQLFENYRQSKLDELEEILKTKLSIIQNELSDQTENESVNEILGLIKNEQLQILEINKILSIYDEKAQTTTTLKNSKLQTTISEIKQTINKYEDTKNPELVSVNLFLAKMPTFIYFDSFEDLLPYTIQITEVEKNKPVQDFFQMAGIDINYLSDTSKDLQTKRNYLSEKSTVITGDFLDYWNQSEIELVTSLSGNEIILGFKEKGKSIEFSMNQRSKGFQWFLSFYIQLKINQGAAEKQLLIDEPGLYLHAKAQENVLKVFESISKDIPIIFSTHSPYLLEYDKLARVKLVFKDKAKGTIVECKYHKVSDKETLRPILTAIGLELTSGITNPDKLNNVVIEGASDFYYLSAFKKILAIDNLNFIYGGGIGNMPHVGRILQGWGCKVIYLFDNDQGKKDGTKNLCEHWEVDKNSIYAISTEARIVAIEDLFTKDDFISSVLGDKKIKLTVKNSEYAANQDKVILAKKFNSNFEKPEILISETTKDHFRNVMQNLGQAFSVSANQS